jgi:hypothetical protein
MGDRKDLQSPLMRAKFGILPWLDALPKDARLDAEMALDNLVSVAFREIEQAYIDGVNNRSAQARAQKLPALTNGE